MIQRYIVLTLLAVGSLAGELRGQTPSDISQLIEELAAEPSRAVVAAEKLARLGPEARPATEALAQALASRNVRLRISAANAIKSIGPGAQSAIAPLIKMLDDRTPDPRDAQREVRSYAADALAAIGPSSVEPMLAALDPQNAHAYEAICTALHYLGPEASAAVPTLIRLVEKNDEHVVPPVYALQGIGPAAKDAVPALIKVLDHPNFHAQYFACRALGAIGRDAQPAVEKLMERLKNGATSVRRHAAAALGDIGVGGESTVAALIDALNDPLQPVQIDAVIALGRLGEAAAPASDELKKLIARESFTGKARAAGALWRIDPQQRDYAIDILFRELQSDEAPWDASQELGKIAPQANRVADIIELLDNERDETREFAAEAIGYMGEAGKVAMERLESMANDERQPADVRTAAREAVLRLSRAASSAPRNN